MLQLSKKSATLVVYVGNRQLAVTMDPGFHHHAWSKAGYKAHPSTMSQASFKASIPPRGAGTCNQMSPLVLK